MTLNSSDQLFESLSAMVDNEASELEMRRVLKNMENNPEVLERWRRYHLIGSVMRKEHGLNVANPGSLVSSISNSLSHDTTGSSPSQASSQATSGTASRTVRDMMGKTAIAASFAAVLVMGFNYRGSSTNGVEEHAQFAALGNQSPGQQVAPTANFSAVTHVPVGFELPLPEARTVSMTSAASAGVSNADPRTMSAVYLDDISDYQTQEMLNRLLIQHAERASVHGSLGIMPFARVHKMQLDRPAK